MLNSGKVTPPEPWPDPPVKPFFAPIYGEYYLKIKAGEQNCEIRPLGHRGWNTKNIYPGRQILFSFGYGKKDRTLKTITRASVTDNLEFELIPQWHIDAVKAIYPTATTWLVAYV